MKKVIFIVVIFMLILSGCKSSVDNNAVVEVNASTETIGVEPELKETEDMTKRETLYTIADSGLIDDITVKDAFVERILDVTFSEYMESGLLDKIANLYFDGNIKDRKTDSEYLYQVIIRKNSIEYTLDIYMSEQGPFAYLNDKWETIDCDETIYEIIEIIHGFVIRPKETEDIILSETQIIEYFKSMIAECKDIAHQEIEAGRLYSCTQQDKIENWNPENPSIQSYIQMEISNEQISQLFNEIELSYSDSPFAVAEDMEILNAELNIRAIYEEYEFEITANDSSIYVKTWINGDNYRIKIENKDVYITFLEMIDSNIIMFDLNDIANTEYITLHYVKDEDLKDFPNNKRLSEKKITDKDTVDKIVQAVIKNSMPTSTYSSREEADLIFHTSNSDVYFKIKNPITDDEDNLQRYNEEPTIIAEGYFWYSCPEMYQILMEYFNK